MLQIIGRGKGAKLRIIPASGKGIRASSNIANPAPNTTEWTEISPGVWQCTGLNIGAATTLFLAQEADGLVIGQAYLLSATITGTADILIRSGSTTIDTNWDGSPKIFIPNNGNFNIFQRAGGYTIQSIVVQEAVIMAVGVTSFSEIGSAAADSQDAVAALGVESASEVGVAPMAGVAALGVESASEVGSATVASMEAPVATGVESASEVAMVPADTTAPIMSGDSYTEGTFTFAATISEPATMHYLVSAAMPETVDDIIFGIGLFKTTIEVTAGVNNNYLELSAVPAGTYWFAALPVDAFNNADYAEAHIAQYTFPGGYAATGIESASEVGSAAVSSIDATAASGVESASEIGAATADSVDAPATTGVESSSEIGSAAVASVDAPAATGVESASEIGTASQVTGTTRRALEISSGTGTAGGLEWNAGTPGLTEFTFSAWCMVNTGHGSGETIFAGPNGTVQIYTGATNAGVMVARVTGGSGATTAGSAYPLDTWFHLHVQCGNGFESTIDCRIYINGSAAASITTTSMSSTAMNGTWWVLQDDGADDDFNGRLFDVGMFGSIIDISDANYSGGSWTDFGSTTGIICRLDGQTSGDATQDSSGNNNDWSQSSGGGTTVTSESSLPSGANP